MPTSRLKPPFEIFATALTFALVLLVFPSLVAPTHAIGFTSQFRPQDCTWKSNGRHNPFFSLRAGDRSVIEGEAEDDGETVFVRVEITNLRARQRIMFTTPDGHDVTLRARIFEEVEYEDGELIEISRNFVARCAETNDIFYFGEDVDDYEDGEIVGHGGAWRAGVDGAQPGILMPGRFLLGSKYMQEVAPGVALDRGRNIDMGLEVPTPAGTFTDCVVVLDSNGLEPDAEGDPKVYCPGVGLVMDEDFILVETNR